MNLTDDEMRVKCAEAMGWLNIHPSGRLDGQKVGTNPACPIIGEYEEIPNYPASVDAALTLCDRLREEGIESELANNDYDLNWEVTLNRAGIKIEYAADPSLARAICLAFLKVQDSVANSL